MLLPRPCEWVLADVLKHTAPLDIRHLAAGEHQRRQQDLRVLPLSITARLLLDLIQQHPGEQLSVLAYKAATMGAQKEYPSQV